MKMHCWALEPENRASFKTLSNQLEEFLDPEYNLRYQEAREEMLRRYSHISQIQQNRLYFNMSGQHRMMTTQVDMSSNSGLGNVVEPTTAETDISVS